MATLESRRPGDPHNWDAVNEARDFVNKLPVYLGDLGPFIPMEPKPGSRAAILAARRKNPNRLIKELYPLLLVAGTLGAACLGEAIQREFQGRTKRQNPILKFLRSI